MGMGMGVGVDSPREAAESTDTFVVDMHLHTKHVESVRCGQQTGRALREVIWDVIGTHERR